MSDIDSRGCQTIEPKSGAPFGNQNNAQHGGAGALARIQDGQEFIGLAAVEERQVQNEIDADGILPVITKGARRLETAARLYWNAVQAASEQGDIAKLTGFVKVFGWLQASAIRSLSAVREAQRNGEPTPSAREVLDSLRGENEQGK